MYRLAALLLALLTSSACLRSTTMITVGSDGSGTIVQETGMNAQALAMLKGMAPSTDQPDGAATLQFFGEEQARKAAEVMGVRFVSGEAIKAGDLEGYRAHYAFDDIRKLQVSLNQDPTTAMTAAPASEPPFGFDFERRASSSVLTITVPDQKQPGASGQLGALAGMPPATGADSQVNAQAVQMMKVMMQGMFVDVSLSVDGRIVSTDARHVSGSRITLLQLDFDRLLADEGALQKLQGAADLKALEDLPGLKVIADRKVTVEFAR